MARYDDLPIQRLTVISLVSIAVTVVSILAVQVLYFGMSRYVNEPRFEAGRYPESEEFLARQSRSIGQFAVNPQDGNYAIPVEQAMRKLARESSAKNDQQSVPSNET